MRHISRTSYPKAFTLIELLVVISIVALLSSVVLASLNAAREKARIAGALQFEAELYHAVGSSMGGYWNFEEGPGATVAKDIAGNGVDASISGATYVTDTPTGKGYALSFNGSSSSADIPVMSGSDLSLVTDPGAGYTMAAWFKAYGLPVVNDGYIVFRAGAHDGIAMQASGIFYGAIWFSDGTNATISTTMNLNDGKWHFLAMSVNDVDKKFFLFVDGKEMKSAAYSKTLRSYGSSTFNVGGKAGNPWQVYGVIDDAMIFGAPFK